jgi:hypothetical protein
MAEMITKEMLDWAVEGVVLSKIIGFKADKDSTTVKQVNLEVDFSGVPLRAVFAKALGGTVITWQNGPGRSKFDTWKSGQTVKVSFAAPAKRMETPEETLARTAAAVKAMSPEDRAAYLAQLEALLK